MALTLAQFSQAVVDATLRSQFQGAILKLTGYILNGDPATTDPPLRAARLAWAQSVLSRPTGQQFLVDSSARFLRYSVGTSGVFLNASSISATDAEVESMTAIIAGDLDVLQLVENSVVQP